MKENDKILDMEEDSYKKRINYLHYVPPVLQSVLTENKDNIFNHLKEKMVIIYESKRYDKIVREVLDPLTIALKLYKPPKETKILFVELLAKMIFQTGINIRPAELGDSLLALEKLLVGNVKGFFTMNWEPVFQLLRTVLDTTRRKTYYPPATDDMKIKEALPRVIYKLKKFFPIDSGLQIYNYVKGYIGSARIQDGFHMFVLHEMLRTDAKVPKDQYEPWMKEILALWDSNSLNRIFGSAAMSLISALSRSHYEIDWEPYMDSLFTHIMNCIYWQTQEGVFHVNVNKFSGFFAPEENLSGNVARYCAKLAIYMIKPHPEGKSRALNYIEKCLCFMKNGLYGVKRQGSIGFIETKFIQSLLFNMCNRLKLEKTCKRISEEQKLKPIDIRAFTELIIDVLEPCLLVHTTSQNIVNSLNLICFLYPEKAFDHYIPKFVKFFDDYTIPHFPALSYLYTILTPLIFSENFPKKFYYINLLLEHSIKEVISVGDNNNLMALKIIENIFNFMPLTHQKCLENTYAIYAKNKGITKSYDAFLHEKKKSNELEFYYHEMQNNLEPKMTEVLSRIFEIIAVREKPTNKEEDHSICDTIFYIASSIVNNSTQELFDILRNQFKTFITDGAKPNALKEVTCLIHNFSKRDPINMQKIIVPYVFKNLVNEENNPKIWNSPLGLFIQKSNPEWYNLVSKYSLNKYLDEESFVYYCGILGSVLLHSLDSYSLNKDKIHILLTLLLLENNNEKNKQAGHLLQSILFGRTEFIEISKPLPEQKRWSDPENILNSYKKIGQFDETRLEIQLKGYTKDRFEECRELIEKFGFKVGEFINELSAKSNASESVNTILGWLHLSSKIIQGCIRIIQKDSEIKFNLSEQMFIKIFENDAKLLEFYKTLRVRLLNLLNNITLKLLPIFANQLSPKLAKKNLDSLLNSLLVHWSPLANKDLIHQLNDNMNRKMYQNPTIKDYVRKSRYYIRKIYGLPYQLCACFERNLEIPNETIKLAVNNLIDTLAYVSDMVFFLYF